ncbi:lysophospholipid acyltransferase family protein [Mucilaginibacter lappiensis]|uniref:1-acyl-sn-glycerol-3-phosphate acyltransferase n=1 Tax=Mucilaginibacter lappiensis TaxID=354630 RepID=A0A841JH41_9SPHI|nr:lysophospholipid acyltransferase family protein [Mucilaginibacter lappiensis]MBB6130257.1 1-acyl-sn-glycerol-3-phosphate acyltransferase [Mucilaginibacter lappiensis]
MVYPKKNRLIHWFFHHYILRIVGCNFHEVKFDEIAVTDDKAVLLLANHFSWWDGFLMYYLNHKLFGKKFHVMVIENTVRRVSFFKHMGAFSVNKNSRDVLQSINYAAKLLEDPQNLVLIFPQGKLYSNFVDQVHFEKGIWRIIEQAQENFRLVFSATFIQYLKYKKPTATVYLKSIDGNSAYQNIEELAKAYQQHYDSSKQSETEIIL